ncbi:MAG: aminoacyl-tRNA hydrolase [Zetaproteobacteria bacterium CG12_big_fil_rev_8_21_14_0_65_55_1124]|nr:MAG: aminoacyl-tRNA hydrolase [Zetaproteobacteria bacterium CG08_land_8_20_14_0_20_55_17]PIW42304.1 MAG: aminoacyl-tRNA hydrolase [Zetaproteobacteria bacterium CG12_big_fil_rev_8_21_14_0_65_55_1124]PIY52538.1 MAG: aminoacyl-tRNA hydrolase [Zetaproteobacteria bacterium CG_4_10_14_0_8_um_filter_55_43]PIZ36912.1 MAG: aminoacyl-tRNA hydrolase [Zetaproteobacteria bacterium CG_4_10_14_0_2_um_filter_55_20]PJB80070.1 MAG: aminoacyl-tRNA hydrolase [Zetaproteobacteria bacterium CG_4_9_14_0_8_um_filter
MQLLVGLGNPGNKYETTRHNIGFRFVDTLAEKQGLRFAAAPRFKAELTEWQTGTHRVLLVKPQTFMNNSGECVGPLAHYYGIESSDIFVVYDDLDLASGKFRMRTGGGHGGHNGLKSLNQHLPDGNYHRLKIGIGRPPAGMEVTPWVLGRADATDREQEARIFAALLEEMPTVLDGNLALAGNHMHLHLQEK